MDIIIIIGAILFISACVVLYIVTPSTPRYYHPRIQPDLGKAFPVHYESPIGDPIPPRGGSVIASQLADPWIESVSYRWLSTENIDVLIDAVKEHCPPTWQDILNQKKKPHYPVWHGMSAFQIDLLIDAANESSSVILALFNCGFPVLKILKPVKTNPLLNRPQNPDLDITIRRHFN